MTTRLNKYIASCGVSSRRGADEMIAAGHVRVDGEVVTSPGMTLNGGEVVELMGRRITPTARAYLAMNKARGILSAVRDARERTVIDVLPARFRGLGLFPVGRLDKDSEGLIIITNDGDFAQRILHPSNGVTRTYSVELASRMGDAEIARWMRGVETEYGISTPISIKRIGARSLEIVLGEGFKREIRLSARELGDRVVRLKRIAIGKFLLEKLPTGAFCEYNLNEISRVVFDGGMV